MKFHPYFCTVLLLLSFGCSDDANSSPTGSTQPGTGGNAGTSQGGAGGDSNQGGAGGDTSQGGAGTGQGGTAGANQGGAGSGSVGDLSGHWVGTSSDGTKVDVTISSTEFLLTSGDSKLHVHETSAGVFAIDLVHKKTHNTVAKRKQTGPALGIFPFPLTGEWQTGQQAVADAYTATASLSDTQLSGKTGYDINGLPDWLYVDDVKLSKVTGSRVALRESSFGALSGDWQVSPSGGGACTMRFEGTSISAECKNAKHYTGTFQVTVSQDALSGSLSSGLNFSATRL